MRLLVIEDDRDLADAVASRLIRDGHAVDQVARLEDAKAAVAAVEYAIVVLDLHLPDGLGLRFLRELRAAGSTIPVLIVTARDQVRDRIDGLNAGADDYLTKPFDMEELVARVLALLRRSGGHPAELFTCGALVIDWAARQVWHDDKEVSVTGREWAILSLLAQRRAICSKAQIEDALYAFGAEIESNTVEVYISRLRRKLSADTIETVRGLGYRLRSP